MNLDKLLELLFANPDNISIQYTNVNGKEQLTVNGEDLIKEETTFDDSEIKRQIANYKSGIEEIDDTLFGMIIDEAEKRHFNLSEMNKGLELEHYTYDDALYASNTIQIMSELIQYVIKREIQRLMDILEKF